LKILFVITDLNTGGVPLHLLRLARYLSAAGESVCVVSLSPLGPVAEPLSRSGIETLSCEAAGPWDWRVVPRLGDLIGESRPDVVHALLFHANVAARLAAVLCGFDRRRLICEIQTVEIERRWHLAVDCWTQGLCRWVVGNSPSVIQHLASRAHIDPFRLRLIQGGVDAQAVQSAQPVGREALGIPGGEPLLLWVGRLDPIKGLDVLVEATAILIRARPVQVAIVGDGPYRTELERLVARASLTDRIHLLGRRDDVPRLLRSADVFVFPSRTEGLPNALLEAMAAGLPVVTTDAPGCRDLIAHGCTGLIVPVDDAAALAREVERVLSDGALSLSLGQAATAEATRNFMLNKTFRAYRALYAEAAAL
jgi:starch synthase (maltosyl-transferring)